MNLKLQINNLNFKYNTNDKYVLKDLNLKVYDNEIVCIRGANGAGKSTLLRILSGLIFTDNIFKFKDEDVNKLNIGEYKKKIAYISDTPYLYEELTGIENIRLIMNLWNESQEYLDKALDLSNVMELKKHLNKEVRNYSLGMKHKLFLIAMLSRSLDLIFLDEPLNALDIKSQNKCIKLLKDKVKEGVSIVFITHIKKIEEDLANRVLILKGGNLNEVKYE